MTTRPCCPLLWLCEWRPRTCTCPPLFGLAVLQLFQSTSSSFRVQPAGKGTAQKPTDLPGLGKEHAGPSRKQSHPRQCLQSSARPHTECCGCSFLCVPTARCSDQSTGQKLQCYPALGRDLLCDLGHPSLHSDLQMGGDITVWLMRG